MARILLVDDELLITSAFCLTLEDMDHYVITASDGQEGLERALKEQPDIVITDYMMPKLDGLEMIRRLRANGFEAPIILTTSVPISDPTVGYDIYLRKPYFEPDLVAVIDQAQKLIAQKKKML